MKADCDVIRDLLPLYADDACSAASRALVDAHLPECPACREELRRLRDTEIERGLRDEKTDVIGYGAKKFRRRSAQVGALIAALFSIPILVCLIVNAAAGTGLSWFFIVLAAMLAAASLTVVPLMAVRDKAFWTFCAFTAALILLLAAVCLVSGGDWFLIAASAALFGLAVIFLPFVIRARPVRNVIGRSRRWLIVLGVDAILFVCMIAAVFSRGQGIAQTAVFALGILGGGGLIASEIMQNRGKENREE